MRELGYKTMKKRKLIGLIIPSPEEAYQQRVMKGVFEQCNHYDYDVAVFSSLVPVSHTMSDYLKGESTIYGLMNLDKLDGIIVVTLSVCKDGKKWLYDELLERLKDYNKPVISLDLPFGDYETVYTDDRAAFSVITEHILDVHQCKNVYFLTGHKGHDVSKERLAGYIDVLERRGLPVNEDNIFYGDFWYSGGEQLADKIEKGKVPMPDAVICASDHMAIGLANRLVKHNIRVPEDIIVTGFDATAEAAINDLTITTYRPEIGEAASKAVDAIVRQIEPELYKADVSAKRHTGLRICGSCGCHENLRYIKYRLNDSLYNVHQNFGDDSIREKIGISRLLESYMYEDLTNASDPEECLRKIYHETFLIRPFSMYYLCLREDWLDVEEGKANDYPEHMKIVISATDHEESDFIAKGDYATNHSEDIFETKQMLPQIYEERKEPAVFYFTPVHFIGDSLGYSVLQCPLSQEHKINHVFRNWVRYVNNALKMVSVQNKLRMFSERDAMTGLYNRRGMRAQLNYICKSVQKGDSIIAFVIDMDGLKAINDVYGHDEGDYGINVIANVVNSITRSNELCIRAGGDEFYIIGIANYAKDEGREREVLLKTLLDKHNRTSAKEYEVSASIGYHMDIYQSEEQIKDILRIADQRMYESKVRRKKQRQN